MLDVRSPGEYDHAHIPNAISFPLFTDEERKIVGTAYKQKSREDAIKIGLDFFAPKMRKMVEDVETLIHSTKQSETQNSKSEIFLYCWRGGMRSAAIAWLLDLYGFKVHTLARGYKAFRNHVLQTFQQPFLFKILGGYTGSGKTEVLSELERCGEAVIDLEKIASHKGSAFGSFKMPPQPAQEMFENLLAIELWQKTMVSTKDTIQNNGATDHSAIWLEDESQRIGLLNIPTEFWNTMRNSAVLFIDIPFEERLSYLTREYGQYEKEKLVNAIIRIQKRLGGLETKTAINHLLENDHRECFRVLLKYYDKCYGKALFNRENLPALLNKIAFPSVEVKTITNILINEKTTAL